MACDLSASRSEKEVSASVSVGLYCLFQLSTPWQPKWTTGAVQRLLESTNATPGRVG